MAALLPPSSSVAPTPDPSTCLDGFPIDADIAGPGVRSAFYTQTLSTVLFVWLSPKDVSSSHWSMISTSLGLSVTGVITGARKEISLIDAIIIMDAVLLAFYACDFMNSEFVSRMRDISLLHHRPSPLWILCTTLSSMFSCAFGLYVWSTAPTFGSSWDECNSTMTITIFDLNLKDGRNIQLIIWGGNTILFIRRTWINRRMLADAVLELFFSKKPMGLTSLELLAELSKKALPLSWLQLKLGRKYLLRPPQFLVRNFDFIWALSLSTYTIASIELTIKKYKKDHNLNTEWNFGQVLPVLLILSPVFSLIDALCSGLAQEIKKNKQSSGAEVTRAHQFSSALFVVLWFLPDLRNELLNTLNMSKADLKVLEMLVAEAYERWDREGRNCVPADIYLADEDMEKARLQSDTRQGTRFATILWDALNHMPSIIETLRESNVVDDDSQLEDLKIIVSQTWDLWKAHEDRTRRFRWWAWITSPRLTVDSGIWSSTKTLATPAVGTDYRSVCSAQG